jgi:hypothetical protein
MAGSVGPIAAGGGLASYACQVLFPQVRHVALLCWGIAASRAAKRSGMIHFVSSGS